MQRAVAIGGGCAAPGGAPWRGAACVWGLPLGWGAVAAPAGERRRAALGGLRRAGCERAVTKACHAGSRNLDFLALGGTLTSHIPGGQGATAPTLPVSARRPQAKAVHVKGFAPSLDILQRYRANFAPLRFGAGLKGKVADSWWHGLPVCTTPIGSEGMAAPAAAGAQPCWGGLCGGDTPEGIVADAVRLYTDPELWSRSQDRGFELLRLLYDRESNLHSVTVRRTPLLSALLAALHAALPALLFQSWGAADAARSAPTSRWRHRRRCGRRPARCRPEGSATMWAKCSGGSSCGRPSTSHAGSSSRNGPRQACRVPLTLGRAQGTGQGRPVDECDPGHALGLTLARPGAVLFGFQWIGRSSEAAGGVPISLV